MLVPELSRYLSVIFEEKWTGAQIRSFGGYGGLDSFSTDLTSEYDEYFELGAATYDVSVSLLKAMAKVESGFTGGSDWNYAADAVYCKRAGGD